MLDLDKFPFAKPILEHEIERWLMEKVFIGEPMKNRDYPFDEDDSYSWAVKEMKAILAHLKENR